MCVKPTPATELLLPKETYIIIDYTNWRGERRHRPVEPKRIAFKGTEWHPTPQWMLEAIDLETGVTKDFALTDNEWLPG